MKLDPVFLVAPKPKPPSMPTRRALLMAGGAFVLGSGLGGACGYAAGVARGGGGALRVEPPEPSGNSQLDDLRRLALTAPIDELVDNWPYFLDEFALNYRRDSYLPEGVVRLAQFAETAESYEQRGILALVLIDTINRGEPQLKARCGDLLPLLRRIR